MPILKNSGPLLVDKIRGYFDRLPPWLRDVITIRSEKQKVDAKVTALDSAALESELKQEVTDEKLRTNRYLGDGEAGSGNDMSGLPVSHPSEVVITQTGQVASVTETVGATEEHLIEGPPLQDGTSEQVGDLWVTKKVEAPTFDRKSFQKTVDDLLPAEFRAAIAQDTTVHTVDGVAVMPTLGVNDLVKKEEQVKVGVKETTVQSRDLSGAKPTLIGQRLDPDFNGATLNLSKDVVPDTTTISQTFGDTDIKVLPYDDKNAIREKWRVDAANFPVLTQYSYEPEVDAQVITEVSVVGHGTALIPPALTLDYQERKIDARHKLRVINRVAALPPAETTWTTQPFTFPAILTSLDFRLAALGIANRSEVQWTAGVRAQFTVPTKMRIVTTFYDGPVNAIDITGWAPGDIMFKGVSFSISLSNLLFETWNGIGVTFAADAQYGNLVDRFNITATFPTPSVYNTWIGTEKCVSSVVDRYKNLWRVKNIYVKMS